MNKRVDYGDIDSLAESILSSGLKTPILLKKIRGEDKYELIHGHRRYRGIQKLIQRGESFPRIKAFLAPQNYTEDDVLLDMIVMNDGKPFNNYEQGLVFLQLVHRGFTETEISSRVGKSTTHIRNCVEMGRLPKSIQNEIAQGNVSGLTAVDIVKQSNSEEEAIDTLQESIKKAQAENNGEKKKATSRHASISLSPFKTLEKVKKFLKKKRLIMKKLSC